MKGSATPEEAAKKHKKARILAKKNGGGRGLRITVRTAGNTVKGIGHQAAKRRKARSNAAKTNSIKMGEARKKNRKADKK